MAEQQDQDAQQKGYETNQKLYEAERHRQFEIHKYDLGALKQTDYLLCEQAKDLLKDGINEDDQAKINEARQSFFELLEEDDLHISLQVEVLLHLAAVADGDPTLLISDAYELITEMEMAGGYTTVRLRRFADQIRRTLPDPEAVQHRPIVATRYTPRGRGGSDLQASQSQSSGDDSEPSSSAPQPRTFSQAEPPSSATDVADRRELEKVAEDDETMEDAE